MELVTQFLTISKIEHFCSVEVREKKNVGLIFEFEDALNQYHILPFHKQYN